MLQNGIRRFDLYDFFSILIPGAAFLIALFPFFPSSTSIFSTGSIVVLIVFGFVFGRALHALGLLFEILDGEKTISIGTYGIGIRNLDVSTGHRDYFINEVISPNVISPGLVDEFLSVASDHYGEDVIQSDRNKLDATDRDKLEKLYTLVRSYIHIDSRGRSRTFQAVLDFQRTMVMTSILLAVIYITYAGLTSFDLVPDDTIGYTTFIAEANIEPWVVFFVSIFVLVGTYITFERIRDSYRKYFIQYLMADFLTLQRSSNDQNNREYPSGVIRKPPGVKQTSKSDSEGEDGP